MVTYKTKPSLLRSLKKLEQENSNLKAELTREKTKNKKKTEVSKLQIDEIKRKLKLIEKLIKNKD
jgi:hypothetical protein